MTHSRSPDLARYALAVALICIAASLAYFSYNLLKIVEQLPAVLKTINQTSKQITPLTKDITRITDSIPSILKEVEAVRLQIPKIIEEVAEIRKTIPIIIDEVALVRNTIPPVLEEVSLIRTSITPILQEVALVREQIPPVVAELSAYKNVIANVLVEVEQTRVSIPPTLDKLNTLIDKASTAGTKASEGAVSGLVTGVVKMPFKIIGGIGGKIFSSKNISEPDSLTIIAKAKELLKHGLDGDSTQWKSKKTNITLAIVATHPPKKELAHLNLQKCRTLSVTVTDKKGKTIPEPNRLACLNVNGEWSFIGQQ